MCLLGILGRHQDRGTVTISCFLPLLRTGKRIMHKKLIEKIIRYEFDHPPEHRAAFEIYAKGGTEQDVLNTKNIPDPWRTKVAMVLRDIRRIVMSKI